MDDELTEAVDGLTEVMIELANLVGFPELGRGEAVPDEVRPTRVTLDQLAEVLIPVVFRLSAVTTHLANRVEALEAAQRGGDPGRTGSAEGDNRAVE